MTSLCHIGAPDRAVADPRDAYLDAAREALLAHGWSRTTLTDIARRAGVSRMTLYRTWPDMRTLLADLMTREWAGLLRLDRMEPDPVARLADGVVATVAAIRDNAVFRRIVELDPQLLLPYLLERPGRAQQSLLALLETEIRTGQQAGQQAGLQSGQQAGRLRAGDPGLLARTLLLAAHGFVLSAHTVAAGTDGPDKTVAALDAELRRLVERHLEVVP
ncbi:MAG: TetR/AcrR family transcriptional regulator [Marmoricola sp.]